MIKGQAIFQIILMTPKGGRNKYTKLAKSLLFFSVLGVSVSVLADEDDAIVVLQVAETYDLSRDGFDYRLQPLDFDLVGDSIDINSGAISFSVTDVSLPGNSSLEVAIRRKASEAQASHNPRQSSKRAYQPFADWVLDVPTISTFRYDFGTKQMGVLIDSAGCFSGYDFVVDESTSTSVGGISQLALQGGVVFSLPGKGTEQIVNTALVNTSGNRWDPIDTNEFQGASKKYSTLHCKGGYSEIKTRDGVTYTATQKVLLPATSVFAHTSGTFVGGTQFVRYKEVHLVTQARDVHGNTVNWRYDNLGRLTQIFSNDGRSIDVNYNGNSRHINTVVANGRTWQYHYSTTSYPTGGLESGGETTVLSNVVQPDGTSWEYDIGNLTNTPVLTSEKVSATTISITHPFGTQVEFELESKLQDVNRFELSDRYYVAQKTRNLSLIRKTVSGSGIPTSQWNYSYEEPLTDARGDADFGDDLKLVTKTAPDGGFTEYFTYPIDKNPLRGKVKIEKTYASENGSLLQEINNEYLLSTQFGEIGPEHHSAATQEIYLTKKILNRNGDTYTTEYEYETDPSKSDYSYGLPLRVTSRSNLTGSTDRVIRHVLTHKKDEWLLGLTSSSYLNGKLFYSYVYDSIGRLQSVDSFGSNMVDYTYYVSGNQSGLVASATDAIGRVTKYENYHRGIPEKVTRAYGTADALITRREVDDNGWIMNVTDGMGRTDVVERDSMGRLTSVNPYGEWFNTDISYQFPVGGGVVQTIDRYQQQTTITYDGLLRSILEKEEDIATGWYAYQRTEYNEAGLKSFSSYPSDNATTYQGITYEYDALNRIERQIQYPSIITIYSYQTDNKTLMTDPDGYQTTTRRSGFGSPDDGNVVAITSPESVNTAITYNLYNKLSTIRQYGSQDGYSVDETQRYFYDSRLRLCRQHVDELGSKLFAYDDADQLTSYSEGQSYSTACTTPSAGKVSLTYDYLGQLKNTNYSDSTPDISQLYDQNGNIKEISRGSSKWTYDYYDNDTLRNEFLEIDGLRFSTVYERDGYGHVSQIIYPSGEAVSQFPDAFGRPTKLSIDSSLGSDIYADNVQYHHNKSLKSFSYGNGVQFYQELDSRQLPETLEVWKGSVDILDYRYSYDDRGNITYINDGVNNSRSVSNNFDGMSRLKASNSAFGNITFKYDAVGNLRNRTITGGNSLGGSQYNATMNFNNLNQVSSVVTPSETRSFGYDSRGNVTNNGIHSFSYDLANQPTSQGSSIFVYDGNLKRVKKTANGKTVYFVYTKEAGLVSQYNKTTSLHTDLVRLGKQLIARVESAGSIVDSSTLPFNDTIYSKPAGGLSGYDYYLPFGKSISDENSSDNAIGFTGHVKDDSGLTYMQARYYDPVIGRFYSNDPVDALGHIGRGSIQGFNRYNYAYNNPYKYTDPDGQLPFLLAPIAMFVIKELAAEAASQATGGATDFLSTRRMATKGVKQIIKSTKELRGGSFNQSKKEVIDEANGVCSYCQNAPATQGDHAKTLNSFKADVNEGKMTAADAKKVANGKDNIVASCAQCNQVDKHTKDLGTGPGQYNPPNPDERVKDMLD